MKAFKGFEIREDGGMWCKDFKYEVGKTYKYNGDISLCKSGFHACRNLHQVWQFYPNNGTNVFYEVECGGKIDESFYGDGKIVCSEIKILDKIDVSAFPKFHSSLFYMNGFMRISGREGCNYIDENGKLISKHWFDDGMSMHMGWIAVSKRKKWNFINKDGRFLLERGVDFAESFYKGLAMIRENNRYNLVDTEGNLKFEEWQHKIRYHNASWEVDMDGKWITIEN